MMAPWKQLAAAAFAAVACLASSLADTLKWDASRDVVTAEVESWTVPDVLQRVAGATGWQIFLDPEITNRVPTRFSEKQPGDALRSLLGKYNYALVPDAKGPSRLLVFRDSRDQATRVIQPVEQVAKRKSGRIPNELVVTLKPGEKIEDLAKSLGAKIVGRSDAQNTYRLRFEDEQAAETAKTSLESDPAVETVDSNYYVSQPELAKATGLPGSSLGLSPKVTLDGKYTIVGLIDSAVQPKAGGFEPFVLSGSESTITGGAEPTHGTSMAATILSGAKMLGGERSTDIRLALANAFPDGLETTTTYDIAVALFKAAQDGAFIFNVSAGGEGLSTFLEKTVGDITAQGGFVVAAAGNSPVTTPIYPAAFKNVFAVTALAQDGKIAPYANRGEFIDGAAPGWSFVTFNGQRYQIVGTSTSTAYVSGIAASIAESQGLRGEQLREAVLRTLSAKKQ